MAISMLDVQRVAVIGSGTMGSGIAQVAALAGYETALFDAAPGVAQKAVERIGEALARAVDKGKCTAAERTQALGRLRPFTSLEEAAAFAHPGSEAAPGGRPRRPCR